MKTWLSLTLLILSLSASAFETGGYYNDVYVMKVLGFFKFYEPRCEAMKNADYREFKQMFEPLRALEFSNKPTDIKVLEDKEFETTIQDPKSGRKCTLYMPRDCGRAVCK